jgi:hypothetical protein
LFAAELAVWKLALDNLVNEVDTWYPSSLCQEARHSPSLVEDSTSNLILGIWIPGITRAAQPAGNELDALRNNRLNPPEWTKTETLEFPGSVHGPWKRYVTDVDLKRGVGTVRYPRRVAKDAASAEKLKKRTLTNLYNQRPTWLANLHAALDRAVWAAYGWKDDPAATTDENILGRLLTLNGERAAQSGKT